ncbi:MAG: hypothetical protein FJY56_00045 [Betaproteobacteria bacterium]|nr:hypothetical protein [Betaproteobacteria bacterium]
MQLSLHIPHLIPPREAAAVWAALDVPSLKRMLARARYSRSAPLDDAAVTCESFGIGSDRSGSIAPLLARADGVKVDDGYWLCVTPAHLETRHHTLVLADPALLQLTAEESQALAATLAEHLRAEQLTLHAPRPDRWYLRCDQPPAISTSSLASVAGHGIDAFLPKGADALRWHRLLTEMQMLLHAHPVNEAREAAGRVPVNNVWIWGGGTLPAPFAAPFQSVWSNDALVQALARHAGIATHPAVAHLAAAELGAGHHWCSYHALTPLMRRGDLAAWGAAVIALDRDWFQALRAGLRARQITRATLVSNTLGATHRFDFRHWDAVKIFNKIKYL